ncbi:hypothetical protein NM688_g4747 [Phlebia brevispora]|uniref:Uncharacterized protein n=1 Tax=Phlebia brevispora TaxID=194682 RepID=A0ACC1T281_9APHY|nr:hypothetical protein NM688_g4747 [Phlebia brevispora]
MFANSARRQAVATHRSLYKHSFRRLASTSSSSSPSSTSSVFKYLQYLSIGSSIACSAYFFGSLYPPTFATYLTPRIAPPPPDPDHPQSIAYTEALEDKLQNLPYLREHRNRPDAHEWYETRPFVEVPKEMLANSLTAGALRGPGKLALPPLVRARRDESEAHIIIHVGSGLCGHEGIVHGGMLATLLDESLGRLALLNLPDKVGVTAYLNMNYRAPTRADQFVVIKTRLLEQNGRKVKVAGTVEDLQGNVLVEANALFVQPRYSKLLNTERMHAVLGRPPADAMPPVEGSLAPSPIEPPRSEEITI